MQAQLVEVPVLLGLVNKEAGITCLPEYLSVL